ncbi:putative box C/D snoRNA protein [Lachnellula willkommii]|uniref:Box C/D snoRNA protein 1 n=1 Tax=Lachnellula willkommii TaxID=215461 RepID=A0A559MD21_9HELO|nr:putative box C/D snoRNA protein [Lachnellula willkommii]
MADPLLSTLCSICHINTPKYTCPRCSVNTCSLPCSRRHKLWSSCNGVRDPTVFVPKSQLATPSGIDHDYNFLHSIEHRKGRSEKEIVENRRLVKESELKAAREGEDRRRPKNAPEGEACINRILLAYKIRVYRAPSGMKRNTENTTNWSKKQTDINWQVEWIRDSDSGRLLEKALGFKRVGEAYYEAHESARRSNLTSAQKNIEKKRKLGQIKERYTKRMKLEHEGKQEMTTIPRLQCSSTGAWNVPQRLLAAGEVEQDEVPAWIFSLHFYLHRPNTPSTFPKVLVPLDPSKPLLDQLRKRELMEFPTIYIREQDTLPENCMLEKDFLKATGQETTNPDEQSSSSEEESDDDSSTSGSDSDSEIEEGEVR